MKRRMILLPVLLIVMAVTAAGCGATAVNKSAENAESQATQTNQTNLLIKQPVPVVSCSLERQNIINRYHWLAGDALEWPCKSRVGFVYLISQSGKIMSVNTVKGKVSNLSSQLTNPQQLTRRCGDLTPNYDEHGEDYTCQNGTVDQAEPDGSYSGNGTGIYFFTPEGKYVEWHGDYNFSDQRLDIQQPSENVIMKVVR